MASIYANAYLTITATSSSDWDDGLFSNIGLVQATKINITETSGMQTTVHVRS